MAESLQPLTDWRVVGKFVFPSVSVKVNTACQTQKWMKASSFLQVFVSGMLLRWKHFLFNLQVSY